MFSQLVFDNAYTRLPDTFYVRQMPVPRAGTRILDVSPACAELLGLSGLKTDDPELLGVMSGQSLPAGADPLAQKYTGHQFGSYNPALGDGRGLLLGEVVTPSGSMDLHLKGAGQTPFSRFGDGNAVLRSSLREYLASEAMAGLGIPTTRALAVAVNDEHVRRERVEPGATLLRVAESHVRFGHFEWLGFSGRTEELQALIDHVIARHRPHLAGIEAPGAALFDDIVQRTAQLVADWQAYGFVHAVMNTDNMSALGLTLDYGPYTFLDAYIPDRVPNLTDSSGRYAFNQQPGVALWNLVRLAQSLVSCAPQEQLEASLQRYEAVLQARFAERMRARFGLTGIDAGDSQLCQDWLTLLADHRADYHLSFRALCDYDGSSESRQAVAQVVTAPESVVSDWLDAYDHRLSLETRTQEERHTAMRSCNPCNVLRLHHIQAVIDAATDGDTRLLSEYRACLQAPFTPMSGGLRDWQAPPAPGSVSVAMSCSS
ncbi:protein adenylyltransferase SelO [Larsenimonas rhizosphaerae]|uniref:Protein nucleotidyltransferase YdiU n=1 Tax=Larsenimonas rhizosphaerae TaxID=2944682 RepID=A0AA41ZJZ3_9GAMM|nr:YdiU family protein [Larsenimonas rhizosphaerae]MCX2523271.1 YdiU family protein [Larsenimonas rhizosphaerae]